ncbi:MAG: 50S ribosomal protein L25, partial [Nitrososphaera sp.]|nr:50S ribosomal protein L25 [Nitrososphaera sp.]
MRKLTLQADARTEVGNKVRALRRRGQVPAIVYGHGIEARSISVAGFEFTKVFRAAGESTIVELAVGQDVPVNVLITDTQSDPVTGKLIHADFFQVRMDEKIEAAVPLEFSGEAPAVKELGGILLKTIDAVDVKSLPADLPHSI